MSRHFSPYQSTSFLEFLIDFERDLILLYYSSIKPGFVIFLDDFIEEIFLIPRVKKEFDQLQEFITETKLYFSDKTNKISIYFSSLLPGFSNFFKLLFCAIVLPFLLSLLYSIYLLFSVKDKLLVGLNENIASAFFSKYFYAFSWYGSWLGVIYNVTAILGVSFAVMTYYKNNQSQASINHFSNVQLFREYVQAEISKSNRLSPASFDLMAWYSCIYPFSKSGVLICSEKYKTLMSDYDNLISSSNFSVRENGKEGFKYMVHQAKAKKTLSEFGISIKETNRLGYHEVESDIIYLIEKINGAFPTDANFKKFRKRSYL